MQLREFKRYGWRKKCVAQQLHAYKVENEKLILLVSTHTSLSVVYSPYRSAS